MTDLEAKISSEFASGDPTQSDLDAAATRKMSLRFSPRRIIVAVVVLLILAGGVITYFASVKPAPTNQDKPGVAVSEQPAVQATTTDEHANTPSTASTNRVAATSHTPAPAMPTPPAPNSPTVPAPSQPAPAPLVDVSGIISLTTNVLETVVRVVSQTLSAVL